MTKRLMLAVLVVAALAVGAPMGTAGATPPADIEMVVDTIIGPFGGGSGPFTAFGPAVDDGLFCDSGFTYDRSGKAAPAPNGNAQGVNIQVFKVFECGDGSGTITAKLQVRINRNGNNFHWNIVEGTGGYEDLHGTGSGFGIFNGPGDITDVFSGGLHAE